MIDQLKVFFTVNDSIVHFVHGQVFFLLAVMMGVQWFMQRSRLELSRALPWLAAFGALELLSPRASLLGTGGTVLNLAAMALAGGIVAAPEVHGCRLTHACVAELLDLLRYMPVEFRKRCPGLEPERADIILAGAMILHQVMGTLSAPVLTVTCRGIRHGCVYALAQRKLSVR